MTKLLLFLLVMTFGVFVQSTVGFGGPLIIMPLGLMLLPLGVVKPVTTFTAWLAGLSVLITDYKYINWRELAKMAGVMLIGVLGGMWLTGKLPSNILLPIYGAVVAFIGVQRLFFPTGRQTPKAVKNTALALSGLMQGLFVSGGSFLAIYAVDQLPEKREFRATVNAVWGILNTVMLITFWTSGGLTPFRERGVCFDCPGCLFLRFGKLRGEVVQIGVAGDIVAADQEGVVGGVVEVTVHHDAEFEVLGSDLQGEVAVIALGIADDIGFAPGKLRKDALALAEFIAQGLFVHFPEVVVGQAVALDGYHAGFGRFADHLLRHEHFCAQHAGDHEEGRLDVVLLQQGQQLQIVVGVAVVEGEDHGLVVLLKGSVL